MKIQQQPFIASGILSSESRNAFQEDLTRALLKADIPFHKLKNEHLRKFLNKYMDRDIPDESTLRKKYVPTIYDETISQIRADIGDSPIWISVDETTDACGRFMVHVIVGKLSHEEAGQGHLILCKEVEKTNNSTIVRSVQEALSTLWLGISSEDRVRAFVTDSAAYMLKAGECLKVLYPKMLHVTCTAHAVHRVAEEVRKFSPAVNDLISAGKKIFVKAPSRVNIFKEMMPGVPLPPEPILTRWGTWISAALYYTEHGQKIQKVIETFDEKDNGAIQKAKLALQNPLTWTQLNFIKAHFHSLPKIIESLEIQGASLQSAVGIIQNLQTDALQWPGPKGKDALKKLEAVLRRNPDWDTIVNLNKILEGEDVNCVVKDCAVFKYLPIVSTDVERSFSKLKNILQKNRLNLTTCNLEKFIVVQYNKFD